jgi:hypothetical protein
MKFHRRTQITFKEARERVIRIRKSTVATVFCDSCACPAIHLPVSQAASLIGLSELAIFRLVESRQLHSVENTGGTLLICRNSLLDFAGEIEKGLKASCSKEEVYEGK